MIGDPDLLFPRPAGEEIETILHLSWNAVEYAGGNMIGQNRIIKAA